VLNLEEAAFDEDFVMNPTSTMLGATGILRVLTVALVLAFASVHAAAQGRDIDLGGDVPLDPPGLTTRIGWQTGYEDNVFRSAERPVSDIVSTLSAGTELRGRLRRVGLSTSGSADWVHFDKLVSQRGADLGAALRLDFLFNRIVPYVSGSYRNTRQRLNPEIDIRPRIEQSNVVVGSIFRIGGTTAVDVSARHAKEGYDRSAALDGVSLGAALNRASDSVTLSFLEQVTPLTRLIVAGEMNRDRFNVSSNRSADNVLLTTGFESDGRLNGSARVGVRILKPHDPSLPESRGLFMSLGTSATVLDRVQIGLIAERDVVPSYMANVDYYGSYNYSASVTYAMRRSLRLSAQAGQRLADYRARGGPPASAEGVDHETRYGSGINFRLGESMGVDFSGAYTERTSISASRRFDGLSVRAGVNYDF
jgi:Putative beta-barrel porin 2